MKLFGYYQCVMYTFESFEKTFSLGMFLVFSKSVIDIFFQVMNIYGNGRKVSIEVCKIVMDFISITSITLVASQFSEIEKTAKGL